MQVGKGESSTVLLHHQSYREQEHNLHGVSVLPHAAERKKKKKIKIENWRELSANFPTNMK